MRKPDLVYFLGFEKFRSPKSCHSIEKHASFRLKCWPNASVTICHLEICCCVHTNWSTQLKISRSFDAFTRNPRRSFNTFAVKHHPQKSLAPLGKRAKKFKFLWRGPYRLSTYWFFLLELEPKLGYGGRARYLNKARYSNSSEFKNKI